MRQALKALMFIAIAAVSGAVAAIDNLELVPAAGGQNSYIRQAPTYVDARVLSANVSETHTVPSTAKKVIFSGTCNFYAKPGASAAVPAADVSDGTAAELNPAAWNLEGVTQVTLIAGTSCVVTLTFQK